MESYDPVLQNTAYLPVVILGRFGQCYTGFGHTKHTKEVYDSYMKG